jgi:hypothetical protein
MMQMQRKRLGELTIADLERAPVWVYKSDTDDTSAWVEETELTRISEEDSRTYLAATEFILADGTKHYGYCSPADWSGLDYVQPVLLTPSGGVRLWLDPLSDPRLYEDEFALLEKPLSSIFPLSYRCLVPVDSHWRTGHAQDLQQLIQGAL